MLVDHSKKKKKKKKKETVQLLGVAQKIFEPPPYDRAGTKVRGQKCLVTSIFLLRSGNLYNLVLKKFNNLFELIKKKNERQKTFDNKIIY